MNNDMTERSVIMFNMATNKNMSISEAADMLKQCADFRTLSQKLNAFAKGRDIKKLLINGLSEKIKRKPRIDKPFDLNSKKFSQ